MTWDTVSVELTGHPRTDPDETFTVSLSNLRGGGTTPVVLGNSSVTTTIKSTPLAFSVSGPEFVDEGTKARFMVTRNVDLATYLAARVSYATSDGTATAGTDYTAASGKLEMPLLSHVNPPTIEEFRRRYSDWEILVPVTADNVDESNETFTLTLSNPETFQVGYSGTFPAALGTATATTTIRDRAMVVSVSGPETVVEDGNADFTVSLSRAPTANLTVNYQTYSALAPARLATSGEDFTAQSGTLTFVPGETSKRVRVPVLTDATMEPIEYFRLLLAGPSGGGGLTPTLGTSIATTGIVDAAGPLLGATLTVTPASGIGEGDGTASSFTVKVDLDCCTTFDEDTTVTISLGGTATGNDDYTATIAHVTIPATTATGSTAAALSITPVEDAIVEGEETIVVNGSLTGFVVFPDKIDLTDNDTATVGISGPSEEVEEGANAEFTVTLSSAIAKETTVAWSTPLATDTAVAADLGATSGTVTFPADSAAGATQTLSIPIIDDTEAEPAETFTVSLGAVGGDLSNLVTVDPAASSAEATIAQDEEFAHITLSFNPEYVQEGQSNAEVTLTATRDSTVGDHTLDWSVYGTVQTATDGTNYTLPGRGSCGTHRNFDYYIRVHPTDVRIAPGESSASTTVTYHICSDDLDESNETIAYTAVVPGSTVTQAILTIGDPETITLSASPKTVGEDAGATEATVTATLSAAREADTVVNLTLGGTATDTTDYTTTSPTSITIPKGETSADATLTITPVDDILLEDDETITVSGESGARPVNPAALTIITITDNDTIAETVNVSGPEIVMERNSAIYTISLSPSGATLHANLTVDYATSDGSDPYLGPAAVAGRDYTAKSGTVTFTPTNAGPKTITVPILGDTEIDSGEVFTFSMSNLQGGGAPAPSIGNDKVTTVIIDANKDVTLTANRYRIGEHENAAKITLTATREGTDGAVTITGDFPPGGTATPGALADPQDYLEWSPWSITIPDGQKSASTSQALEFTVTDDDFEEEDETIIVNGAATGGLTVAPAVLTIEDNDKHDIMLTANTYTIEEGKTAARVTLTATRERH